MKRKRILTVAAIAAAAVGLSAAVWAAADGFGMFDEPAVAQKAPVSEESGAAEQGEALDIKSETPQAEKLSANDSSVKTEIAKYNANAADFRYDRKEEFSGKSVALTFNRAGYLGGDESQYVTYKDGSGNEYVYNSKSGELFSTQMTSLVTKKNADSIDIKAAERVAYSYAAEKCNIDDFKLSYSQEISRGYAFVYSKDISGLRTSEAVEVTVGYNGDIVGVRINTGIFEDKSIKLRQADIDKMINAELQKYKNAELQDKWLDILEGKVVLNCQLMYEDSGSRAACVAVIPVE